MEYSQILESFAPADNLIDEVSSKMWKLVEKINGSYTNRGDQLNDISEAGKLADTIKAYHLSKENIREALRETKTK